MTSETRQHLADAIAKEHAARETQQATRQAIDMARTRCQEMRDAVEAAENALTTARKTDPDELISAAKEGRAPATAQINQQRYALAAARDELEAAEQTLVELKTRLPDYEGRLAAAKSSTNQTASQVIQSSPEWAALIETTRHHEQELGTCYAIMDVLTKEGVYHSIKRKFDPAGDGDLGAGKRMREAADQERLSAWVQAMKGLQADAETPLPSSESSQPSSVPAQPEIKTPRQKRGLFSVK
ncbi:hypothetical protein [Acetobacter sicerae]|uniref:hypothetical protein n=1 Tax=Acetobacter sicerae TaxID=85325 RepID=UPI00156B561D|nr:hypothetical protein [Acetobacter sicerae]NHN93395.1 hypothetical protein [Acetobacter sicerae]